MLSAVQLIEMPTLFRSEETKHWQRARRNNVIAALAVSAAGGVGGSMAAMFVMVLDGKVQFPITGLLALRYISTCVIAGFLGFQFLKIIAKNFGDKFGAKEYVDDKTNLVAKQSKLSQAITLGIVAQDWPPGHPDIALAIRFLEEAIKDFPDNRRANIILGELYAGKQGNLSKSISLLEKARDAMKQSGSAENRAAVDFNIACYHSRLAKDARGQEANRLKRLTIDHLRQAIDLWPPERVNAAHDEDFAWLREMNDPDFLALIGETQASTRTSEQMTTQAEPQGLHQSGPPQTP